ncbi:hypothetical protein SSX86_012267 [Deinandra increscens subsp. villosa]|uniref:FH2 domain-containing protein n=1 Tax=Deinandra increscens subsp. villosa TaxID=3103831 RepID=A0AAP0D3X1_9ASTR
MDSTSLETFSGITFQCLKTSHEERPTMARVVEELETALQFEFQKSLYKCIKVDLKRANDMEIMLKTVNMQLPDIMVAALSMDESILDGDQIENLIKLCPTKEDMELLKNYTGDKEMLGKYEQFYLELMKVPRVQSKLHIFLFKIQFNTQVLPHELSALLNSEVELVNLEAATKIQLKYLAEEMRAISEGMGMAGQELEASADEGPVSEVFHKTLQEFVNSAEPELRSLMSLYTLTGRNADALTTYFGKDPARQPFEQVTQILSDFLRLIRRHPREKA